MWITPDVNIPNGLLEAHRENRLVVFAGAGVSVASGLPLFNRLAYCIGEQTGHIPTQAQLKNPDRFLGDLSEHTDVHRLASNIIGNESSTPNALHDAILRLTTAGDGDPRIVTTNYDLHLSTAADLEQIQLQRFDGPALPMGDDFSGIIHLHGSLNQEPRHLVLTDKDFGRAYLTDAWAAQFLHRMFRQYTVLFIGYSHADMVMEYLARGLPRGTERYALTPDDDISKWRRLEIHPIPYPVAAGEQHTALNEVVVEWAERVDSGLLTQRQRISDLVNDPPPEEPVSADYLEEALTTQHAAVFFTEFARGEAWLAWAETQPSFKALATDTQTGLVAALAQWFVTNFVLPESETHRALRTIQILGGRIGRVLWAEIALGLFRSKEARPSTFKTWVALLLEADPDNRSDLLFYLLSSCKWPGDRSTALLLLDYFTTPHITMAPAFPAFENHQSQWKHQVRPMVNVYADHYWLPQAWETIFKPHLDEMATDINVLADSSLRQAHHLMVSFSAASNDWDPDSFARSAIEAHEQDQHKDPKGLIIDMARDSIEYMLDQHSEIGSGVVESWARAEAPILRRLAVHGWSHRRDKSSEEKVTWLLTDRRLFDDAAKHENFRLIKLNFAGCPEVLRNKVVETVVRDTPQSEYRDYSIYNFLSWISETGPDLESAAKALRSIRDKHPEYEPSEYPDFDHWTSSGSVVSAFPLTADELHQRIQQGARAAFHDVVALSSYEQPGRSGWQEALECVSTAVVRWPEDGELLLTHADDLKTVPEEKSLWRAVIDGWARAALDNDQWRAVLDTLERRPKGAEVNHATARLLEHGARRGDNEIPPNLNHGARQLARSIWSDSAVIDLPSSSVDGWYGPARYGQAGIIAEFWIHSISSDWRNAGDDWSGLSTEVKEELESMIADDGPRGAAARTIFGSHLRFLFGADEQWCGNMLLPLFIWSTTADVSAQQVWDGYLQGRGGWNERLLDHGLLDLLVDVTPRVETHLPVLVDHLCAQLAGIALNSKTDPVGTGWLRRFISLTGPATRQLWASRVRESLSRNTSELAESRWKTWIRTYWTQRLESVPAPLSPAEAAELAGWTPYFIDSFTEAVRLATSAPAALVPRAHVVHGLIHSDVLKKYPHDSINLLTHLLSHTRLGEIEPDYQLEDCVMVLRENTDSRNLVPLVEAAIRAGYQNAASWLTGG